MLQLLKKIGLAGSSAMIGAAAIIAVQALAQSPQVGQQYKAVTVANRAQIEEVANDFAKQGWRLHSFSAPTLIFERK
jgi:hypothetical protein